MGTAPGTTSTVSIQQTFLPPAVATMWYRIQTTLTLLGPTVDTSDGPGRVTQRPDLGRNVLVVDFDGADTVRVVTDDGTEIMVQSVGAMNGDTSVAPLTIEEQLDIINSLRSVGERPVPGPPRRRRGTDPRPSRRTRSPGLVGRRR